MPIYAYRCIDCGHAKDVLQKLSDPVLTHCAACGTEGLRKQVTAAGFQLKGSGWYVTDFRGGSNAAPVADPKAAGTTGAPDAEGAAAKAPAADAGATGAPAEQSSGQASAAPASATSSTPTAPSSTTP
jgi:putative FmdB family regulatory protein